MLLENLWTAVSSIRTRHTAGGDASRRCSCADIRTRMDCGGCYHPSALMKGADMKIVVIKPRLFAGILRSIFGIKKMPTIS